MYRLPRSLAVDFLHLLSGCMDENNNFYASGSYQRRVGADGFAFISQTVVSRCVRSISFVIATKMMDQFIQFPQSFEEIESLHAEMQSYGFSRSIRHCRWFTNCAGRITENAFMNRKGFHSINTQFISDARMRSLNVNARYPGSTHDSLIWISSLANSFLRSAADAIGSNWEYFLLGDNGYPLQPWLLKPFDSPDTWGAEIVYNIRHRKLHSLVERAIGLLKARFRCLLGKMYYDPLMSGYIIYSCSVLHNFLIANDYPIDDISPIFDNEIPNFEENIQISYDELEGGRQLRNLLAEYFINN